MTADDSTAAEAVVRNDDPAEDGTPCGAEHAGTGAADHDAEPEAEMTTFANQTLTDPLEKALAERDTLIRLCMYALDRARSNGVVERLAEGMDSIGVHALRAEGERFDPARHEAAGTVGTDDPALEGLIAETEVIGFADHDRLLRAPVVTVYRTTPPAPAQR